MKPPCRMIYIDCWAESKEDSTDAGKNEIYFLLAIDNPTFALALKLKSLRYDTGAGDLFAARISRAPDYARLNAGKGVALNLLLRRSAGPCRMAISSIWTRRWPNAP